MPEPQLSRVRGHDSLQAGDADCVGAGQQLGAVLGPVVPTQAGRAGQEGLAEVLVVDGHGLNEGGLDPLPSSCPPKDEVTVVRENLLLLSPSLVAEEVFYRTHHNMLNMENVSQQMSQKYSLQCYTQSRSRTPVTAFSNKY